MPQGRHLRNQPLGVSPVVAPIDRVHAARLVNHSVLSVALTNLNASAHPAEGLQLGFE